MIYFVGGILEIIGFKALCVKSILQNSIRFTFLYKKRETTIVPGIHRKVKYSREHACGVVLCISINQVGVSIALIITTGYVRENTFM